MMNTFGILSAAMTDTLKDSHSINLASTGINLHDPAIMPRTPFRVLFVCLGNICRSPAGENMLRHLVHEAGLEHDVKIDSAGTHDYHPGKAPDKRMTRVLGKRGISNHGRGRQFTVHDFSDFDLILVMDSENLENVQRLDPEGAHTHKVKRMTDFCTQEEFKTPDVPDPYYGGEDGFAFVADLLSDGCQGVLEHIRSVSQ
jgi:protein-tyrosine phosphatase